MFRKLPGAMTRNNFLHDFLVHKTPRPIARRALFVRKKRFDAVIVERGRSHAMKLRDMRKFNGRNSRTSLLRIVGRGRGGEFLKARIVAERIEHWIEAEQRGSERHVFSQRATAWDRK